MAARLEEPTPQSIREVARAAHRAGLCVVPPHEDGTKAPLTEGGEWKQWQIERPSGALVKDWYSGRRTGVGIITGSVSGHVELFEFEQRDTYQIFRDTAEASDLGELVERIEAGYLELTPGGGVHWLYRCATVGGSTKLARRPRPLDPETGKLSVDTLIETKGEGGYVVLAPSWGRVHPTGGAYRLLAGGVDSIATITPDERDALFQLARAFDELPKPEPSGPAESARHAGTRPGDEFNTRATWDEVLTPHGWTSVYRQGGKVAWRRPDKAQGISATTNWHDSGLLYVFSSSTAFTPDEGYSKWRAWAVLNHGGDFKAAARALGEAGYGSTPLPRPLRLHQNGSRNKTENNAESNSQAAEYAYTDTGNAERLVALHGVDLRHCRLWGKWLAWDGQRWRMDDTGEAERRAKDTARSIIADALDRNLQGDDFKAALKWATASDSAQRRMAMVKLAESEPDVAVLPDRFDGDPWLLSVANGTLDLRTATLRAHAREDLITRVSPVAYDADATCPTFLRFLGQITADPLTHAPRPELEAFLQRAAGYSLTGIANERVLLILYGHGANGKSTFLEIVRELMGDFATRVPTETLMAKRSGGIPNDIARLKGARFVFAAETDEGRRLSEALIKDLTGTDTISARFMRGEFFDFKPEFKLWLATNHKPNIRGTDPAIWDRIRLIPFDVRIAPEQQDKQLLVKLRAELPGILAWAVAGCLAWQRDGLGYPAVIRDATAGYRAEMNVLETWLDDCCAIEPHARCTAKDLYASYKAWCDEEGERFMRQRDFGVKLTERNFTQTRGTGGLRSWKGLRLVTQPRQVTLSDVDSHISATDESSYRQPEKHRHSASLPISASLTGNGDDDDLDY